MSDSTYEHTPEDAKIDVFLPIFKALADANRLKIIGLLAQRPQSGEQLAQMLGLRPPTVSHHLARLIEVGLVSARPESYYNIYRLETEALEAMARRLLQSKASGAREALAAAADGIDAGAYDRKVVANFTTPDGRLRLFPAQRKKFEAILRYVLRDFEPGVHYSEKRVNEILGRYHEDTAALRRGLVEFGMLQRTGGGGDYWRPEE